MPKKMHRRTVLRGVLGGATVGVALPALEIFLNDVTPFVRGSDCDESCVASCESCCASSCAAS